MSAARRSLLTATAAGTLLGALWFVPSANATQDVPTPSGSASASMDAPADSAATRISTESDNAPDTQSGGEGTRLADTGSVDTTPYLVGGTLFLCLGSGFVTYSVRRERTTAY
ncbi:hypothetical protein ABZX90_22175 [Streptomyces sp. NPDC002935]|uniref:hypothetical protein n=1 Tax=unclassified Streptomyces TaxID=2593676 RepID=UPI00333352E8